jgi:hypothetical protein
MACFVFILQPAQRMRTTLRAALCLFILLALLPQTAWAQLTRYVSTTGTSAAAGATSWATATSDLQGAIDFVASNPAGGEVWVAVGMYKPGGNANTDRALSFSMANGVTIYGGFVGIESSLSQRPAVNPVTSQPSGTTLSGELGNLASTADNSLHVIVNETGLTTTAVLDGVVVTGGNANIEDVRDGAGGGVFNNGGINLDGTVCSPTFRNCLFQANRAIAGGAMANYGQAGESSPVLLNCAFVGNGTSRTGGAIVNDGSDEGGRSNPVLTNCLFVSNRADLIGGAIFNTAELGGTCSPVLTNCAFLSNTSGEAGGAIYNEGGGGGTSSPTLINASFQSNTAPNGGALYNNAPGGTGNVQVVNAAFWNNGDGNTFVNNNATLTATYSLFQPSVTGYASSPTNLTNVTVSPFVSTTPGMPASVVLAAGSAAINVGNPASVTVANSPYSATNLPRTDLLGNPRILGGRVDVGAVEYPGPFSLTLLTRATPTLLCDTRTVSLSVTVSGGIGPYSYTWTAPAGITLSATSTSAISATVDNALTGQQTLTVTVADAAPTTSTSSSALSFTVATPPTPTLTVGPSSTLTCQQTSLTLTATGGGGPPGVSYVFSGPGIVSQNTTLGTALINQPGTYSVVATAPSSCTARSTIVISQSLVQVARLYVSASQTANVGDGLSWETAFTDLQRALSYPCSQSLTGTPAAEIWVATGTYKPGNSRFASFAMRNNLAIIGGFAGTETNLTDRPRIDPVHGQPASSTLSGDIDNGGTLAGNSYHVISNPPGLTNSAVLDGFVITGDNADRNVDPDRFGGGVYNNGSGFRQFCSPTFRNCLLVGNSATNFGGGMYNDGRSLGASSPILINCAFQGNTALFGGGGVYNNGFNGQSNPQLVNCSFIGNSVTGAFGAGGAMFNSGFAGQSNPMLINCSLLGNSATQSGGAIANDGRQQGGSTPVVINSVFWSNGATSFTNVNAVGASATYSLFDDPANVNISGPGNLTTSTSPFVSTTPGMSASVALAVGSPAINAGHPNSVTVASPPYSETALPAIDLAGNPRIVQDRVDMGAVEYLGPFSLSLLTSVSPNPVCAGASVALSVTASAGTSPYSYTWAAPAGITLSGTSTSAVSASVGAGVSGVQMLTITVADGGASPIVSTSMVSLTINALPTNPALSGGTLTCAQTSLTLTASAGGATSFTLLGGASPQTSPSGTFPVNAPGTYTVVAATASGCTASTTATASSNTASPTVDISPTSGTLTCAVPSLTLTATTSGTGVRWSDNSTNNSLIVNAPGTYSVVATGANGCTATASAVVSQNATLPVATLAASGTLTCAQTSLTLTATGGQAYAFARVGGGPGLVSQNVQSGTAVVNVSGTYSVTVTNTATGCSGTTTTTVMSNTAAPSLSITPTPSATLTCQQTSLTLTASTSGTGLLWNTTSTANSLTVSTPGTYQVTATGANGCTSTASLTVVQGSATVVRYVTPSGAGLQNGSSWANAYPGTSLQATIDNAASSTIAGCGAAEVWVATGTYKPVMTSGFSTPASGR